ncbi:MAG: hypothetical protein R3B12_03580 [Candidatus Saccharimonadales bacterium]
MYFSKGKIFKPHKDCDGDMVKSSSFSVQKRYREGYDEDEAWWRPMRP